MKRRNRKNKEQAAAAARATESAAAQEECLSAVEQRVATLDISAGSEQSTLPETSAKPAAAPRTVPPEPKAPATYAPKQTESRSETSVDATKQLMVRPNFGTKGHKIGLVANFFPVNVKQNTVVYHYDVLVKRKLTKKRQGPATDDAYQEVSRLPRFLAVALTNELYARNTDIFRSRYGLAFDGQKNLLSTYKFAGIEKDKPKEFKVNIKNEEKDIDEEFCIKIEYAATINMDIKNVFNRNLDERNTVSTLVYDIVMKQAYFYNNDYLPQGRRIFYYPDPRNRYPLTGGTYRYPGFWQSLRPVHGWKVMINVDQANTAFTRDGPVLDLLVELGFDPMLVDEMTCKNLSKKLLKVVKGLKINQTQRLQHRTAKCTGVTFMPANRLMFKEDKNGKGTETSVADYFMKKYKAKEFPKPLRYPQLPCLTFGPNRHVPMEFCEIKPGQRYGRKLDARQTSEMLKVASQPAYQRKSLIDADMKYLKMDQDKYLQSFGISVSTEMVKLDGRVLDAPSIQLAGAQTIKPFQGGWNMRRAKVVQGCTIKEFGVLITTTKCDRNTVDKFVQQWVRSARQMGMSVLTNTYSWAQQEFEPTNIKARLMAAKKVDLVFVILDAPNTEFYAYVKHAGDVGVGINTQCVIMKNVCEPKDATLANINLKINSKLGGINTTLQQSDMRSIRDFLREPILYLGADVNHGLQGEEDETVSCAAIVGNVDTNPSVFCARIFLQSQLKSADSVRRPQEWIEQTKAGVQNAIEHFLRKNSVLPRRIIMYRDGVGETMFRLVITKELKQMREACEAVAFRYPEYLKKSGFNKGIYNPPMTFIVVQKRHHTRLFCANERDAVGRGKNVPPGTTVDREIVHPEEFDFYLCSHLGLQGTSRPAHYHVLWDENGFTADELQQLTYYLCYTYCRSTRSVSIPPPCYYADLVAYRAQKYLETVFKGSDKASITSSTSSKSLKFEQELVNVKDEIVSRGMFFA